MSVEAEGASEEMSAFELDDGITPDSHPHQGIERTQPPVRLIAGIPVHNFHMRHRNGRKVETGASLLEYRESEYDWIISLWPNCSDTRVAQFCGDHAGPLSCVARGSSSGVPFMDIRATPDELQLLITEAGAFRADCIKDIDSDAAIVAEREVPTGNGTEKIEYVNDPDDVAAQVNGFFLNQDAAEDYNEVAGRMGDGEVAAEQRQIGAQWSLDRIDQRDPQYDSIFETAASGNGVHVYVAGTGIRTKHNVF